MAPTNVKSLWHFIVGQMEALGKREISVEEAHAQASLAKQAFNLLEYERKRAETLLSLKNSEIEIREIEGKAFDNTI